MFGTPIGHSEPPDPWAAVNHEWVWLHPSAAEQAPSSASCQKETTPFSDFWFILSIAALTLFLSWSAFTFHFGPFPKMDATHLSHQPWGTCRARATQNSPIFQQRAQCFGRCTHRYGPRPMSTRETIQKICSHWSRGGKVLSRCICSACCTCSSPSLSSAMSFSSPLSP